MGVLAQAKNGDKHFGTYGGWGQGPKGVPNSTLL